MRGAEPGGHAGGEVVGAEVGEFGVRGKVSLREKGGGEMKKGGDLHCRTRKRGRRRVAFGLGGREELWVDLWRGRVEVVVYGFGKLWGEWGRRVSCQGN